MFDLAVLDPSSLLPFILIGFVAALAQLLQGDTGIFARVLSAAASLPAPGSVMAKPDRISPASRGSSHCRRCSADP